MAKPAPELPEQFFYDVCMLNGSRHQVTADSYSTYEGWLIFCNRGAEVFRYRISHLAGWARSAKPGVTA